MRKGFMRRIRALATVVALVTAWNAKATNAVLQLSKPADVSRMVVGPIFLIVSSEEWPTGLIPLFSVGKETNRELRRLPPRGQENESEPAFFALPPGDESHVSQLAGAWACVATNNTGSRHEPHFELAVDGEQVAGRFGQNGEYRVATVTGGVLRSNRLELHVEWGNDRYRLVGTWRDGEWSGAWRQHDDSDHGTWTMTRAGPTPTLPSNSRVLPLYEWRRGSERRYSVDETWTEAGWRRTPRPLCRVWIAP